jgi:hypothetical protein
MKIIKNDTQEISVANCIHTQNFDTVEIEKKLAKMKKINQKFKELKAEYNLYKEELIIQYFAYNTTYKNEKGLVLATYNTCMQNKFNTKDFKCDYPTLFDTYTESKSVSTFLVK